MELGDFLRLVLRRSWLIVALAALAGAAAWYLVRDEGQRYEQTVSYVMRPRSNLDANEVSDVLEALSEQDSVVQSVAGTLDSERFRRLAAESARLGPATAARIETEAVARPSSAIIDVHFRGYDAASLGAISPAFTTVVSDWVARTYPVYYLETLGAQAVPRAVSYQSAPLVALGAGIGLLLALTLIFVEGLVRRPGTRWEEPAWPAWRLLSVEGSSRHMDRIEAVLRAHLDDGETIIRANPRRLELMKVPKQIESRPDESRPDESRNDRSVIYFRANE